MSVSVNYIYSPSDALSLERVGTKLSLALQNELEDAPLLSASIRLNEESADMEDKAISALDKIIPPLSPLWWKTLGGVEIEVSSQDQPERDLVWLEIRQA